MERKGLDTRERDFKAGLPPLTSLMMYSHSSSGKYEHVTTIVLRTFYLDEAAAAVISNSVHYIQP